MTHKQLNTFWILTRLVAPNIYAIYFLLGYETDLIFKGLGLVPFLLVYSIILSLPTLVLDHLIIWTFRRISQPKKIDSYIINIALNKEKSGCKSIKIKVTFLLLSQFYSYSYSFSNCFYRNHIFHLIINLLSNQIFK